MMARCDSLCISLVLFVLVTCFYNCAARKHTPLIGDENSHGRNRAAECTFGKQVKEIGNTWFADLGPPFGVMYCIKCDCVKVQKKRRVVARVQCRNIKNECPKPTCDEPVLLPGRCCKSCPGDFYSPEPNTQQAPEVDETSMKHFASLLTGRSSLVVKREDKLTVPVSVNKNNVIATGRFTFHRKNLYYSFYVSDKAARPRFLQFMDHTGNILEEHVLSGPGIVTSNYQNVTRKVCGVWKRLPRDYRRLLKDEQLFAALIWGLKDQPEFILSGQVMRYSALGTELFSSLLEPALGTDLNLMAGAGATAIVSMSSSSTPSIHIAIVFNGIFSPDEVSDVPVNITLSLEEKQQIIIQEIKRIKKPAHELNMIEVSSPVSASELRLLTRSRLVLSIASVHKPDALRLSGAVITRATCELFQTTLTSQNLVSNPSGLAWLFLNREGALVVSVQVDEIEDSDPIITLVDVSGKRRTELEDLTPLFNKKTGWANGTLDRLGPRVLEALYSGNLAVNVSTQNNPNLVKGRLSAKPVADARDSPSPILLKRETSSLPATVVGIGWLSVDNDCHVHYDLTISGLANFDKHMQLFLVEMPMMAPGAPETSRHLEDFKGNQLEDSGNDLLTSIELIHLESGVAYLEVRERDNGNVLLKGMVKQIKVPPSCLPYNPPDNDVHTSILDGPGTANEYPRSCYHEGRFYKEGSDWTTNVDPCTMCFCQNGRVKCDVATCPTLNCSARDRVKAAPGECCPPCLNTTSTQESNTSVTRGCSLGQQFHSVGSRWHPFLVPSGFDRCTECTCDPVTLEVRCTRTKCILDCDERIAVKVDDKSCCKQCPNSENGTIQSDQGGTVIVAPQPARVDPEIILSAGGCKTPMGEILENGKEWHPRISSIGEYKCVKCKCQNQNISCERLRCSRSMCNNTTYRQHRNTNEQQQLLEKCCSCKRFRRHRSHRAHAHAHAHSHAHAQT